MTPIKAQDVYLPVGDLYQQFLASGFVGMLKENFGLEKHTGMVLTVDEFKKAIEDAFDAGSECAEQRNAKLEYGHSFTALEKTEYLNTIITNNH